MAVPLHIVPSNGTSGTSADFLDLALIGLLWFGSLLLVFEARKKRTVRGILIPSVIISVAAVGLLFSYVVIPAYQTQAPPSGSVVVTIWPESYKPVSDEPNGFVPKNATIILLVTSIVAWHNSDSVMHTVHSDTGEFDMGQIQPGQVKWYTFTRPGVFTYHCDPHPWRTGTVTVLSG